MIPDSGNPKTLEELDDSEFDLLAARAVEVFRNLPRGLVVSSSCDGGYSPTQRWIDAGSIIDTLRCSLTYDPDIEAYTAASGKHFFVHTNPRRALAGLFILQTLGDGPYVVPDPDAGPDYGGWRHMRPQL